MYRLDAGAWYSVPLLLFFFIKEVFVGGIGKDRGVWWEWVVGQGVRLTLSGVVFELVNSPSQF